MPYLNLDDNFPEHKKVDALSDAAFRLHVAAMCYCAKQLTNGHMPPDRPGRLVKKLRPAALNELLLAELWHPLGEGCGSRTCSAGEPDTYLIHDFLQWNKSSEWWTAKRKSDAERQAEWRANHGKETA